MTTEKTTYLEGQTLDRIFANTAPDGAVDGCYVALWASSPTNTPDETNEITGDSYSPVQVTASGWSVATASGPRSYDNDSVIDFGVLDTSTTKTVAGVVLYDGADTSIANALYYDDLQGGSETVDAGNTFEFPASNLVIEED